LRISSSICSVDFGSKAEHGSVHQDHFRPNGDGARDAEALLLPAREGEPRLIELIFHLIPKGRGAETLFNKGIDACGLAEKAKPERHVLKDGLREWVRFLEDHADAAAKINHVRCAGVYRRALEGDLSLHPESGHKVVHAVDGAEQRALAAARGTDQRRDLIPWNGEAHLAHSTEGAIPAADVL